MTSSRIVDPSLAPERAIPRLFTVKETCALLGVTALTLERWAASGRLPRVKLGPRTARYRADDIEVLIESESRRA